MKQYEKVIHKILLSALFSLLCWIIVKNFIIEINFFRYFLIELILILSMRLLKFTLIKLKVE
jgi:hypothetical protein